MENAVDALKIAFGVLMFVMALGLSISCFSQVSSTSTAIITMSDRETEYTYVRPSPGLTRTVGVETVVPMMYRAYKENFKIVFYESYTDETNNVPLVLYRYTDDNGNSLDKYYIDPEENTSSNNSIVEAYANAEAAEAHLDAILGGKNKIENMSNLTDSQKEKYKKQLRSDSGGDSGLYSYLKDKEFTEYLGEYYQEDALAGTETEGIEINKTKKRVITYVLAN